MADFGNIGRIFKVILFNSIDAEGNNFYGEVGRSGIDGQIVAKLANFF